MATDGALEGVPTHCGCCGRRNLAPDAADPWWCSRCRDHVRPDGEPWARTFAAQHGTACPHQVGKHLL